MGDDHTKSTGKDEGCGDDVLDTYTGNGDAFANPLSDTDWLLRMAKDLQPGEMTADAEDDTYLDDEDADWKTTTQAEIRWCILRRRWPGVG